jgi:hypothetical protein
VSSSSVTVTNGKSGMVSQDIEEPDCYKIRQYSSNVASVRLKVVSGAARILVNKCADEPKE